MGWFYTKKSLKCDEKAFSSWSCYRKSGQAWTEWLFSQCSTKLPSKRHAIGHWQIFFTLLLWFPTDTGNGDHFLYKFPLPNRQAAAIHSWQLRRRRDRRWGGIGQPDWDQIIINVMELDGKLLFSSASVSFFPFCLCRRSRSLLKDLR